MPRVKKTDSEKVEKPKKKNEVFYRSVGRRKSAVARVWLKIEKGPFIVNDKPLEEYFSSLKNAKMFEEPLRVVNRIGQVSVSARVSGGGLAAQAKAVVHGMARSLLAYDETMRSGLSKHKLLTRDPRGKERRKYGRAGKARARKQSPKR